MIGIRMNKTVVLFGAVPVILPTVIICSRRIAVVFDPADGSPTTSDFESCWCRLVTRLFALSQSESPPMPLNPEGQAHQIGPLKFRRGRNFRPLEDHQRQDSDICRNFGTKDSGPGNLLLESYFRNSQPICRGLQAYFQISTNLRRTSSLESHTISVFLSLCKVSPRIANRLSPRGGRCGSTQTAHLLTKAATEFLLRFPRSVTLTQWASGGAFHHIDAHFKNRSEPVRVNCRLPASANSANDRTNFFLLYPRES